MIFSHQHNNIKFTGTSINHFEKDEKFTDILNKEHELYKYGKKQSTDQITIEEYKKQNDNVSF